MPRRLKKMIVNLALAFFVMVILLIFGEIGAGILVRKGIGQQHQISGQTDDLIIPSSNPELSYVFCPYYINNAGDTATNRFGFRDYDWSEAEIEQSFVILNLGDSITFGSNVDSLRDVYSKVLESLLQRKYPDKHCIVFNAGIGGYNLWQERALLHELHKKIHVNMVILGFCLNDSSPMFYVREDIKGAVVKVPGKVNSFSEIFSRKFINRLKLYVMFREAVKSMQRRYPKLFPCSMLWHNLLIKQSSWNDLKLTLLEIKESLAQDNIPLVVVIFPYRHQLELNAADNLIQNDLSQFCRQHEIRCLDLFSFFKAKKDSIRWDAEGIHPDASGHRLAGKTIYKFLIEENLIPDRNQEEVL